MQLVISDILLILIVIVAATISAWLLKTRLRRKMEQGLGRKVADGELTSITTWMKVPSKGMPHPTDKNP